MKSLLVVACACVATMCVMAQNPGPEKMDNPDLWSACNASNTRTVYDFQVNELNGTVTDLSRYKGRVLVIANVATFCAYTAQYLDFNPLLDQYSSWGMSMLAFPCNQFALQEPAKDHEILNGLKYVRPGNGWEPHRNLDIFAKLKVNGADHHPLFQFLKESCPQTVQVLGKSTEMHYNPIRVDDITWNFEKFLIDRDGIPRYRFHPTAWGQNGNIVTSYVERLLGQPRALK